MKHLPSLNGLRAISIVMVWMHHLKIHVPALNDYPLIITDGLFGVNVFFVISGFLITSILLHEQKETGGISLKNFYYRRTIRIFPAYYFMLLVLITLSLYNIIQDIPLSNWLTSITYTKYFDKARDGYTIHAWSLSIEEQFYLLWPLFLIKFKSKRNTFLLILMFIPPICKLIGRHYHFFLFNELSPLYRIDAIALGCLVAINLDKILLLMRGRFTLFFWAAMVTVLMLPYFGNNHSRFVYAALMTTYGTVANLSIAVILLYSICGEKSGWFKFLNSKVMNQIGIWSYSLYLWQQLFLITKVSWFNHFPLNIGLALAASIGSYYCIEKPFLRLKNRTVKVDIKKAAIIAA